MGGVDPRVDDADLHALAAAQVPGGGKALARQVPLVGGAARRERVLLGEGRVTGLEAQLVLGLGLDAADGAVPLEASRRVSGSSCRAGLRPSSPRPRNVGAGAPQAVAREHRRRGRCTADLTRAQGRGARAHAAAPPPLRCPGSTKRATRHRQPGPDASHHLMVAGVPAAAIVFGQIRSAAGPGDGPRRHLEYGARWRTGNPLDRARMDETHGCSQSTPAAR